MGELHSGFDLKVGDDIDLDEALASDHSWTGITCRGKAGEDLVFGELVYIQADLEWYKTDADASATTEGILAIATEDILHEAYGRLLLIGFIIDATFDLNVAVPLYVDTDPGDITDTAPSGSGDQVRKVGLQVGEGIIWFNPDSTVVEVS